MYAKIEIFYKLQTSILGMDNFPIATSIKPPINALWSN